MAHLSPEMEERLIQLHLNSYEEGLQHEVNGWLAGYTYLDTLVAGWRRWGLKLLAEITQSANLTGVRQDEVAERIAMIAQRFQAEWVEKEENIVRAEAALERRLSGRAFTAF